MNVTQDVKNALQRTIDAYGNVSQFAKAVGVAHSTVLFWLSGKSPNINGRVWMKKIRPALLPFLTPEEERLLAPDYKVLHEPQTLYSLRSPFAAPVPKTSAVPLLSLDQIASLDVSIEPIAEFIARCKDSRSCRFSTEANPSYFALPYEIPGLPVALNALIGGGDYPSSGDFVLAKIRENGSIVTGRFLRDDEKISLVPKFGSGSAAITWDLRTTPGYLCWIFPILELSSILRTK